MNALKWWLRIVGVLYLAEGGGLALMAAFAATSLARLGLRCLSVRSMKSPFAEYWSRDYPAFLPGCYSAPDVDLFARPGES